MNRKEEIPLWLEDKVTASVLQWKVNKISSSTGTTDSTTHGSGATTFTKNDKTFVQKTLDEFKGDLKEAVYKAIEENPHIWEIMKKYLEDTN